VFLCVCVLWMCVCVCLCMCVCLCVCVYTDAENKCHTTHCNPLQYTATHIRATTFFHMSKTFSGLRWLASCILDVCCSVLQCVAVCCSGLQWIAVCCMAFLLYILIALQTISFPENCPEKSGDRFFLKDFRLSLLERLSLVGKD